jgi:uncharacterized Zn finger protein
VPPVLTSQQMLAQPPCHPEAESRQGVVGIPVGVKPSGRHRCIVHCPECGQSYLVFTQRAGRKVRVDWQARAG